MTSKKPKKKVAAKKASSRKSPAKAKRSVPESFRARSFSAALTANDLQKTVAWYRDAIGFVVVREFERDGKVMGVRLKAGSIEILINQDDGAKGWNRAKGEGIGLYFATAQSVDEIANRIKSTGTMLTTEPADMPWGTRSFRVKDPDGFNIAISTERPPER